MGLGVVRSWFRFSLWAAALSGLVMASDAGWAQSRAKRSGANGTPSATVVEAREIHGTPDQETVAEGDAELRRDNLTIHADRLSYDQRNDRARAQGNVTVLRNGDTFRGPELELQVETYEGYFLSPTYVLGRTGASGKADRVDFIDRQRYVGTRGTYSTCTPDDNGQRDWELSARRLRLDYEKNEGVAEGAVLRFMGVPILGAPSMSFPLGHERKSGWLAPGFETDSRNGLQVSVPYYWNIAPNMDATLAPEVILRRGSGLNSQFRYLDTSYRGITNLNFLPSDRQADRDRYGLNLAHNADLTSNTQLNLQVLRVSDDQYWKDFHKGVGSLTPRLLLSDLNTTRTSTEWQTYARVQSWQVLQSTVPGEEIEAPYQRMPQIGARTRQSLGGGLKVDFEGEFNHFTNPTGTSDAQHPTGSRVHSLASISRPWVTPAWSITPKLSFNAASYAMDEPISSGRYAGQKTASRVIPTVSLDNSWVLERDSRWFGKAMRQTLEPRLVYAYTPYRDQSGLPNFDASPIDFSFDTIYFNNPFSGVDRVADNHQITAGLSTRLIDPDSGGEAMRLGLVQRYLLSDQRVQLNDQHANEGPPLTKGFSDIFLLGSTNVITNWGLNATMQYNPELSRVQRSQVGASYSPGAQRTVTASYITDRLAPSETVLLGWQWPIYGPASPSMRPLISASTSSTGKSCQGTWYSVGRMSFNTRDSKLVDSILGMEYDGGCWIARIVGRRQSTGINESVTGIGFQLELVGLSRLGFGANPVQLLKENVGGYQPLRNSPGTGSIGTSP